MKKYKMICPNCGTIYDCASASKQPCVKCGVNVVYSGFISNDFDKKTPDEKSYIVDCVKNGVIHGNQTDAKVDSPWIKALDIIVDIYIFIGILASVIGGAFVCDEFDSPTGIVIIILGSCFTLLSSAIVKVLLDEKQSVLGVDNVKKVYTFQDGCYMYSQDLSEQWNSH